ncbi:MAG TPA: tetratricopeptide repeat protein [Xanthomonadales bacterium]|nr:tetratricopeptide repeat protein [Xanthomonadales bacterium]
MVEAYNAHDEGEAVKKWLQENGSAIVIGLVLAFGGLFGFNQWQAWEANTKAQAFAEFEAMNELLTDGQLDAAIANFQNLQDDYSSSPYTSMAALQMGRARIEANQPELAIKHYRFALENGHPKALRLVARERLARMLLDQGEADEALAMITAEPDTSGFEARFAETRGDILFAQGKNEEAIAAYEEALDELEEGSGDRALLVLKLESLGVVPEETGVS